MIRIRPLGKRLDYFEAQFEATEIRHEPSDGEIWPSGPVFPEGHVYQSADGRAYEISDPRTIEEKYSGVAGDVRYVHVYICRPADRKGSLR